MEEMNEIEYEEYESFEIPDLFEELTFTEKWTRVREGLKKPKESGEYKWAKLQVFRLWSPAAAVIVPILILGLITLLAQFTPEPISKVQVKVIEPTLIEELDEIIEPEIEPPEPPEPTPPPKDEPPPPPA